MADEKVLALPGSSWETIKKIIRAFHVAVNQDSATVATIARYADVPRPVVSMNNNFLRSVGLVRPDAWKLTEVGTRYATGLEMGNDSLAAESLADAVRSNPLLQTILNTLRARGELKVDSFKAEFLIRLTIPANDRQSRFVKPLFEMLQEAGLIVVSGDVVMPVATATTGERKNPPPKFYGGGRPHDEKEDVVLRLPIPLGPSRLAHIELPGDWDKRELPKLIKVLQIALGDEEG